MTTRLITTGLDKLLSLTAGYYPSVEDIDAAISRSEAAADRCTTLEQRQNWQTDIANLRRIRLNHDEQQDQDQPEHEGVCRYCGNGNVICSCD